MNIKKFWENNKEEIMTVGICMGIGLVTIIAWQSKEIRRINRIWAKNDIAYAKLMGENEFLGRLIQKLL